MTIDEIAAKWALRTRDDVKDFDSEEYLTLLGGYVAAYETCSKYWTSERTRSQYISYLDSVILPAIPNHNSKCINEYSTEDFEEVLARIKERGRIRKDNAEGFLSYSDSTLQVFRNIIARIFKGCAMYNYCEDIFKDSYFLLEEAEIEDALNDVTFVQRSIPMNLEIGIAEYLLSDITADGETVGALLIYACGLRINESAAAHYGNIREMAFHPGIYKMYVFETVENNSTTLKTSGKTANANRVIPLCERVQDFLLRRREYIQAQLPDTDVDSLPIACVGKEYGEYCTTKQISDRMKEIFRAFGVEPKVIQQIDALFAFGELSSIREKNPTGYLGRHIFATQLEILDLDEAEMQAIIGHEILDPVETRNAFSSEEKIYRIRRKMDRMPVYRLSDDSSHSISPQEKSATGRGKLVLKQDVPLSFLRISAKCEEPVGTLSVKCSSDREAIAIIGEIDPEFGTSMDISPILENVYARITAKIL